mgnify:CR=1 FL=1|jgi:hypothetical protein
MKHNRLIFTMLAAVLCIAGSASALAQDNVEGAYMEIAGKTVDSQTGRSLAYASVSLTGSNISNVSNSEGVFTLKLPASAANSTVKIAFMGYASEILKVSDFAGHTADKPLIIKLQRVLLKLDPATIRPTDADGVFDEAFYRIKQNYPQENISMTAFYREKIQRGSKYLAMNEAVIDISKAPYNAFRADQVGIFKGRGSQNYDSSDSLFIHFMGGPVTALDIDMVKNPFAGVTLQDVHKYYDMDFLERITMNDRTYVVICFNQKKYHDSDDILFRGKIYVDMETYAIGRLELWQNVEKNDRASSLFVRSKPRDVSFMVDEAHYVVNYKIGSDGKWYFEHDEINLGFTTRKRHSIWRNHYYITAEMAVTDYKPGKFDIEKENKLRFKDVLSEKVASFTDEDFWGNYNIIEPDQSIDKIIGKIVKQLKKREAEK